MKMIIPIITLFLNIQPIYGIIGYDCGTSNFNVTTVSLLEIEECNIPLIEPHIEETNIQLLQLAKFDTINVIQCKISISRTIYYCGMHSHIATVTNAQAEYIIVSTIDQCKNMHKTGTLIINVNNVINGLKVNHTTSRPITFAGSVTTDGQCFGTQYSDPYGTWQNVVVQGIITISLNSHQAVTNIETNQIHLKTGTTCQYSDGNCIDIEGKYTFWETIPNDYCKFNHYDILYEGKANKMISDVDKNLQIIYSLSTKDVTFALTQMGEELLCGYTLIKTEHPKLVILEIKKGESFAHKRRLSVENLDIFAYINSKFVYVEKHIRTQMNRLYTDVLTQRCNLERQVMKNALTLAIHAPDDFAYQIMKGSGYMAVISGEAVHIIKCTPVDIKYRHTQECYQQLPVLKGNESYFLAPRTHILFKTGTQTTCSRIIPTMYLLNDGWYRITPILEFSKPPTIMKPNNKPTWQYNDPGPLAASGIYTNNELENLRDQIMFPAERNGILNTMARGVKGEPVQAQGISLSHLLDENSLEKITENAWKKIWGTFLSIGNASAGVIGLYFCIRTIKLIMDTIIHGYALHTIYGWSIYLIGALWDSVTNLLLHLARGTTLKEKDQISPKQELPEATLTHIITENENLETNTLHSQQHTNKIICSAPETKIKEIKNETVIHNETQSLYPRL
ncbi:uncharacterized protein [Temnothorax longispinosus]|uniref:uncharacterized protein n=1 Tax=Temnothorax longispinosus TaxID=300112 RepID=UPI003A9A34A9